MHNLNRKFLQAFVSVPMLCALLLAGGGVSAAEDESSPSPHTLNVSRRATFNFSDLPVRAALQIIADQLDINMVVTSTVAGSVTLNVTNAPIGDILDAIMEVNGLAYRLSGNVIYVAPQAEILSRELMQLEYEARLAELGKIQRAEVYTGNTVTLNFQDIETRAVLQLLAEASGVNIVISDTVLGNLTLRLTNVPWDQALDIVLWTKGLDKRRIGDTILVAPAEEIAAYEHTLRVAAQTYLPTISRVIFIHAAFWLVLVLVYPYSTHIQSMFFWNAWVRRIVGLGYVGVLLAWVPFLRRRLFSPFRESLLFDARLDDPSLGSYFEESVATGNTLAESTRILDAIPQIKGQIILEGDSGLGKSMFLRKLSGRSTKIVVFLTALRCRGGVIQAIQDRVHGYVGDERFLKTLIYNGAIDICIDGLNEVAPDTRATITQFVEHFAKCNIIIGTQVIEWQPPATATTYHLEPLSDESIRQYLETRVPAFSGSNSGGARDFTERVQNFVDESLVSVKSEQERAANRKVLSNPMDLTVAGEMLLKGETPDIYQLQKQQFELMMNRFQYTNNGQAFPLDRFSEHVYSMRLADEDAFQGEEFAKELACMEAEKIVLLRQYQVDDHTKNEWIFRHDKIMDYVLVQCFLGQDNDRPTKHLADSRFRGVYQLLATFLPLPEAQALKEALVGYAAESKDHSISDTFVIALRTRASLRGQAIQVEPAAV